MVVKPVFLRQGDPVFVNIFLRSVCFFPVAKISGQGVKCDRNVGKTALQRYYFLTIQMLHGKETHWIYIILNARKLIQSFATCL